MGLVGSWWPLSAGLGWVGLVGALMMGGCLADGLPGEADRGARFRLRDEVVSPPLLTREEILALAHDYQFKHTTNDESQAIMARIRSLNPQQARFLHTALGRRNNYKGPARRMFEAYGDYAETHNKSFLDLNQEDRIQVLSQVTGAPLEQIRSHCKLPSDC